jgi:hypothetical protein
MSETVLMGGMTMADEHARWAHRIELLAQYEEKKTRVAELVSQFTHKRLEEMTYEDLVHEAGLIVELGTLHGEMDSLLQELRGADVWC